MLDDGRRWPPILAADDVLDESSDIVLDGAEGRNSRDRGPGSSNPRDTDHSARRPARVFRAAIQARDPRRADATRFAAAI